MAPLSVTTSAKVRISPLASCGAPLWHSALCTALTTSVALCHGVADSLFPVCLGFSLIVMYDAIGARSPAVVQAHVLNVIIEDLFQRYHISQRKLNELSWSHTITVLGESFSVFHLFLCNDCVETSLLSN
ncbi:hypothetical protein C5167_026037 [Papaver somniferum]|nr:hypothetical protein C5167_026037 [Papaver somniferum]